MKEKCCALCNECIFDCKNFNGNVDDCLNFKLAISPNEYKKIIREENVNLHKIVARHKLKYSCLCDMLNNKINFKYKYHYALQKEIFEVDEWIEINKHWEENIDER